MIFDPIEEEKRTAEEKRTEKGFDNELLRKNDEYLSGLWKWFEKEKDS